MDPSLLPMFFEMGLMGIEIPEEYGGTGGNFFMAIYTRHTLAHHQFFTHTGVHCIRDLRATQRDERHFVTDRELNGLKFSHTGHPGRSGQTAPVTEQKQQVRSVRQAYSSLVPERGIAQSHPPSSSANTRLAMRWHSTETGTPQ